MDPEEQDDQKYFDYTQSITSVEFAKFRLPTT